MAIVKMKHLQLVAMSSDREALLRLLQRMGCVEIDEPCFDENEAIWAQLTRPDMAPLGTAREKHAAAERALTVLKRYAKDKVPLLQPKPGLTEEELFQEELTRTGTLTAQEINETDRKINAIHGEKTKITNQRATLAAWLPLDLPLDTQSTQQVTVQLGTLPATLSPAQGQEIAAQAGDLSQLSVVSSDREQHYLLLVCHNTQEEAVLEALKNAGWSRANLRDYAGTAQENDTRLRQQLTQLEQEQVQLQQKLTQMGSANKTLKQLADRTAVEVSFQESHGRVRDSQQTFFLQGWVPEERWAQLEQALSQYPAAYEVADPTQEEYTKVPIKLKNNWLTRPLNMVTEMYSLPAYGSVDPNPLMAPFFILFYGIMMADMGYGLLMMLASVVVLQKKRPTGTMSHLFGLLGLCGISTFIMGGLTGGFFGDFIPQLLKVINPASTFTWFWTPLFTPLEDTMMILIGAMCLGVVQIIAGMVISFVKKLKDGKIMDAIWEEITWWVIFAGLALAILGMTKLVLVVGGVMVLVGAGWNAKGFGKVTAVFGSLYNHVTGYFGDILSYSRLMALMLAGSVIAQVFNTLGAIPGNIVIFIVISLAGNTLNFALNLLGCYVHDLRLQCLEYFNKFYQDGGKAFKPLNLNTKYYDIVK